MELPPGFRLHPTDEELITHYLSKKIVDTSSSTIAIGEIDINNIEPWELPWKAKIGGMEWCFFCVRDKRYPTGLRATAAGGKIATTHACKPLQYQIWMVSKQMVFFFVAMYS